MAKPGPSYTKEQTSLITKYIRSSTRNKRLNIRHKKGSIFILLKAVNKNQPRKLKRSYIMLCNKIIKTRIKMRIKVPKATKKYVYVKKKSH